jgi:hypothetical protein
MPSFLSRQSSYGRPPEAPYVDQPLELEAQAAALKQKANLSNLQGMNLPKVDYLQFDEEDYQNLQANTNQMVGELHEDVLKNNGQFTPETKRKAQQIRGAIQNNPQAQILQQRHDRYKAYTEAIEKNPKLNSERKRHLIDLANRSAQTDKSGQFYLPNPTESTGYADKAVQFAKEMSVISDPRKAAEYIKKSMPNLPEENFGLIQSQIYDEKTGSRIQNAVRAYLMASPEVREDVQADTDYNALQELDYIKQTSDPNTPPIDPNQLRQSHFENKVNELAGLADIAQRTQKVSRSAGIHSDALALDKAKKEVDKIAFTSQTGPTEGVGDWKSIFKIEDLPIKEGVFIEEGTLSIGKEGSERLAGKKKQITPQEAAKNLEKQNKQIIDYAIKLGLNRNPDGTPRDFNQTKEALINYGNNLATMSKITVDLSGTAPSENLTKTFFGPKANISNMTFMEQGKPETKTELSTSDNKNMFRNSQVVGLDYTAEQPGALVLAVSPEDLKEGYGDKPYIAVTKNLDLQRAMKPMQQLTTKTLNFAKTGEVAKEDNEFIENTIKSMPGILNVGKPSAVSYDSSTGEYYIGINRVVQGVPEVVVYNLNTGEILPLEQAQEKTTSHIFNTVLPQYSKKETVVKTPYEE